MPPKFNNEQTRIHTRIPSGLYSEVRALLLDPKYDTIGYGELAKLTTKLLRDWVDRQDDPQDIKVPHNEEVKDVQLVVGIPQNLHREVKLLLFDPERGTIAHGAMGNLLTELLHDWVDSQRKP